MRVVLNNEARKVKSFLEKSYQEDTDEIEKDWLKTALDKYYHPEKYKSIEEIEVSRQPYFAELFDEFLLKHKLSEVRKKNFSLVGRAVQRYELFVQTTRRGKKDFYIDIKEATPAILGDIWDFFGNEYKYVKLYPKIYESIPEKRTPQKRSKNTLLADFTRLRTFFIWCYDNDRTHNKPLDKFRLEEPTYGTPYYITLEDEKERLLPFISEQKYNVSIKKIFKICSIHRIVTILDPLTNEGVRKPLYEVASSHLARRTFIGNIYKKVKDPNLVSALSGHKEGSKAFSRYRQIDEEMKKELTKYLD